MRAAGWNAISAATVAFLWMLSALAWLTAGNTEDVNRAFPIFSFTVKEHWDRSVGVYKNGTESVRLGLQKTTLVTIITERDLASPALKQNLFNMLTMFESLQLKSLVYVDFSAIGNKQDYKKYFWSLSKQFGKSSFISDILTGSNKSFGSSLGGSTSSEMRSAYVTARTFLDKLASSSDIILLQPNTIVVKDFVTSLLPSRGTNCSIMLVPKVKDCEFPHTQLDCAFEALEPEEGFLYLRTNTQVRLFLSNWTAWIADKKVSSPSIVSALRQFSGAAVYKHPGDVPTWNTQVTYSYLSEFRFQSEDVLDSCTDKQLYRRGVLAENDIIEYPTGKQSLPVVILRADRYKVSILKNFYKDKPDKTLAHDPTVTKMELNIREMNDYILKSASDEIADRLNILQRVEQGSLVALFGASHIFVVDNSQLRTFPTGEIFLSNNFRWHDVKRYDQNVVSHFIRGPDVRDGDNIVRSKPIVFEQHHAKHKHHAKKDKDPNDLTADEKIELMVEMWKRLANETYDPTRQNLVKRVLGRAAGIYKDKKNNSNHNTPELKKTVLMNVLYASEDLGHDSRYFQMLSNWFCYAQQYGYSPITYYVPNSNKTLNVPPRVLKEIGIPDENLMSYPLHLFWKILSNKTSVIVGNQANYEGDLPSFQNHGAIVMLIPLLEALYAGFNVMYFDLDTMMVIDPVPFMMHGRADFTVQLELRNCFYPSSRYFAREVDIANWEFFEPNTGIFFVRATANGIQLFEQWMAEIVRRNIMNDQKALDFRYLGAKLSFSCNEELNYLDNNATFMSQFRHNSKVNAPTYCYLNEFLFQNGKVALGCARGSGGSKSEYVEDMYRQGAREKNGSFTARVPAQERNPLDPQDVLNVPVMLHFNYCDDKVVEYSAYNAWLPKLVDNKTVCGKFDIKTSSLAASWPQQLRVANQDLHTAKGKFTNGSVVRLHRRRSTFLVQDGALREIPDSQTFDALGYKHSDVKSVGAYNFVRLIPAGDEVPSARDPNKEYRV
jgi:hypothetical protein